MGVLCGGDREAAGDQRRQQPGRQYGLAAAAPSGQAEDLQGTAILRGMSAG